MGPFFQLCRRRGFLVFHEGDGRGGRWPEDSTVRLNERSPLKNLTVFCWHGSGIHYWAYHWSLAIKGRGVNPHGSCAVQPGIWSLHAHYFCAGLECASVLAWESYHWGLRLSIGVPIVTTSYQVFCDTRFEPPVAMNSGRTPTATGVKPKGSGQRSQKRRARTPILAKIWP